MTISDYKRTSVGGKTFYEFDDENVVLNRYDDLIHFTKRSKENQITASFKIDKAILRALILEGLVLVQKKDEKE